MCNIKREKFTNSSLQEGYNNPHRKLNASQCYAKTDADAMVLVDNPDVYNIDYTREVYRPVIHKYYEGTRDRNAEYDKKLDSYNHDKNNNKEYGMYVNAYNDKTMFPGYEWTTPIKAIRPCIPNCDYKHTNPEEQQVRLFGAAIEDANNTQMGSIMPKFEGKEIYDYVKEHKPPSDTITTDKNALY